MKFIREIISGRQDGAARSGRDEAPPRAPQGRGPVLDLDRFALSAGKVSAAAPVAPSVEDDLCRAVSGAKWMRGGRSELSRELAEAIRAPEPARPGPTGIGRPDPDEGAGDDAAAWTDADADEDEDADEDADDFDMFGPDEDATGDTGDTDDEVLYSRVDEDDRDDPLDEDDAGKVFGHAFGAAPAGPAARVAAMPDHGPAALGDVAGLRLANPPVADDDAHLREMIRASAPISRRAAEERPVTELREFRNDPFNRLERQAVAAPAPETPSPFQRQRDRATEVPTPERPRTRLAENLAMPAPEAFEVPSPAAGRAARRAARVRTRLLGFGAVDDRNPFDAAGEPAVAAARPVLFPVGWLVVVAGPGRGQSFTLFNGVSQIGRGDDQAVRIDFGDTSISRSNHAAIAYDKEQQKFYLGHGGKANLVRMNGKPVLSTEELGSGAVIQIGETRLQFVALCGTGFDWDKNHDEDVDAAIFG